MQNNTLYQSSFRTCHCHFHGAFSRYFPGENIPTKMHHMLEDHAVDWIRSNQHIGFGLMGEQGAESIHARFNHLYQTYCTVSSSTSHPVEKLKYIMKEHLLSISPTLPYFLPSNFSLPSLPCSVLSLYPLSSWSTQLSLPPLPTKSVTSF